MEHKEKKKGGGGPRINHEPEKICFPQSPKGGSVDWQLIGEGKGLGKKKGMFFCYISHHTEVTRPGSGCA